MKRTHFILLFLCITLLSSVLSQKEPVQSNVMSSIHSPSINENDAEEKKKLEEDNRLVIVKETESGLVEAPKQEDQILLGHRNMVHSYNIIQKEKKRYNIEDKGDIPIKHMGFQTLEDDQENNLFTLANKKKIKIHKIIGQSMRKVKMWLSSDTPQKFTLKAGTLLYPSKSKADKIQTLILLEDTTVFLEGQMKQIQLSTSCFNSELAPPRNQIYFLSNILSKKYTKGMDQGRVWDITSENILDAQMYLDL